MHCNPSRVLLGFVAAALALLGGGCGPRTFDVTGKVTYNGSALNKPDGQISFVGPEEQIVTAAIGADGTYRAVKVNQGVNRVVVSYPNPQAKAVKSQPRRKLGDPPPPDTPPFLVPDKYTQAATSGLSVTVDKDTTYDVDLTGPPVP